MEERPNAEDVCLIMKTVLSLSAHEAKDYFLKHQSYCNFDIPEYFVFEDMLSAIDDGLGDSNISSFYVNDRNNHPDKIDGVNHKLISNKDGKYSWRPFQLIHPALYVGLTRVITNDDNWSFLVDLFNNERRRCRTIDCHSLPVVTDRYVKDKSEQISNWSTYVEKASVVTALDYDYLFHTDIADCYGSLYTHTVAWALHGIEESKQDRGNDRSLLGNKIDYLLRCMTCGQTNGIPQGSALMDFIAEIVLLKIDSVLYDRLTAKRVPPTSYKIIRYRDDYRIFSNNPQIGEQIVKELSDVLHIFGMKISPSKTIHSSDVVHSSIKADKLHVLANPKTHETLTSELYAISMFAKDYPNSGQLLVKLTDFYEKLEGISRKNFKEHVGLLISVTVDIACKNPRCYPITAAILSKLLNVLTRAEMRRYVNKIRKKFDKVPNTNIMQLWLQRVKADFLVSDETNIEPLCLVVLNRPATVWNSSWLSEPLRALVDDAEIVDRVKLEALPHVISLSEVELFVKSYDE